MKKEYKLKQSNINKNFSSNESKMKISSGENQNNKSPNKNKTKNSKKEKKVQETQTQTGEEQKDNLTILKQKNSKLESDIDIERNNSIQESNNLNLKISEINNEINRLRLDNKFLTNNLYSMQKKLETKINQSMHTKMRNKSGETENNTNEKLN